jgi:c-di-GMP-binding flagellar brake protein YcgR
MVNPDIFTPGVKIKLMALTTVKSKMSTTLVGVKPNKYLIVEQPTVRGLPYRMEEGTDWSANFLNKGTIVGFSARVLGASRHPYPLVFFNYPDQAELTSLRQDKRYPVNLKAVCHLVEPVETGRKPEAGLVRDISEGGCQMLTGSRFNVGDLLELTLDLPDRERLTGVLVEVKSCRDLGGRFILGLSFAVGFSRESYLALKGFINSLGAVPLRI